MRVNLWVLLTFCFISCKSQHSLDLNTMKTKLYTLDSCLSDGDCQLEILTNTSLIVQTDEFKNTFITFKSSDKTVIKYTYKRHELPNTADAHYEEHFYFEIPKGLHTISLSDLELQDVKATYARLCYCKGTSGYYKVKRGNLLVVKENKNLKINAKFEIENIPQLINLIDVEISLN